MTDDFPDKAHDAMRRLSSVPDQAVPYFRERLAPPAEQERITKLVAELDSPDFKSRERAAAELLEIGPPIQPFLENALAESGSAELRRRTQELLKKLPPGLDLRWLRVTDVLEQIGTEPAQDTLRGIANGRFGPVAAKEAKDALNRLKKRPARED